MNRNRAISLFLVVVLLVVTLFVLGSVSATSNSYPRVREVQADQADVQRWVAKGEYYSKLTAAADLDAQLGRDVNAARWQALGEAYLASNLRAREADAARWQAIGEYYSKLAAAVDFDAQRSRDADTARWQAMGEYYTKIR